MYLINNTLQNALHFIPARVYGHLKDEVFTARLWFGYKGIFAAANV